MAMVFVRPPSSPEHQDTLKHHEGWSARIKSPRTWFRVLMLVGLVGLGVSFPRGARYYNLLAARSALASGEVPLALRILASSDPNHHAEVQFLLAKAHRRAGDFLKAKQFREQAQKLGYDKSQIQWEQTLTQLQLGQIDGRHDSLRPWLSRPLADTAAEEFYEAQAKGYLSTYRLHDAMACLEHWLRWRPRALTPRRWFADAWERCNDLEKALYHYQLAAVYYPCHGDTRYQVARLYLQLEKVDAALREFTWLAEHTGHFRAHVGLAECHFRLGDNRRAAELVDAVFQQYADAPTHLLSSEESRQLASAYNLRARVWLRQEKAVHAVPLAWKAVKLDSSQSLFHQTLATALARTGETTNAQQHFAQANTISQRYQRLANITEDLLSEPANVELRHEAGLLLLAQGMGHEGASWLETVLLWNPYHAKTHAALADYHAAQGNLALAEKHRRLANTDKEHTREQPQGQASEQH